MTQKALDFRNGVAESASERDGGDKEQKSCVSLRLHRRSKGRRLSAIVDCVILCIRNEFALRTVAPAQYDDSRNILSIFRGCHSPRPNEPGNVLHVRPSAAEIRRHAPTGGGKSINDSISVLFNGIALRDRKKHISLFLFLRFPGSSCREYMHFYE